MGKNGSDLICFQCCRTGHSNGVKEEFLDGFDLVITTYALIQKYEWLAAYSWNYIILDEAQGHQKSGDKADRR